MSTKIIYTPFKNKLIGVCFLKPAIIGPEMSEFSTLELITKLYKNYVFELVYIRISCQGKYIKFYGIKSIKIIIIKSLLSTLLFLIQFIKFLFHFKRKINFTEFIYLNYDNTDDARKLSFVNNKWLFNCDKKFSDFLINHKTYTK